MSGIDRGGRIDRARPSGCSAGSCASQEARRQFEASLTSARDGARDAPSHAELRAGHADRHAPSAPATGPGSIASPAIRDDAGELRAGARRDTDEPSGDPAGSLPASTPSLLPAPRSWDARPVLSARGEPQGADGIAKSGAPAATPSTSSSGPQREVRRGPEEERVRGGEAWGDRGAQPGASGLPPVAVDPAAGRSSATPEWVQWLMERLPLGDPTDRRITLTFQGAGVPVEQVVLIREAGVLHLSIAARRDARDQVRAALDALGERLRQRGLTVGSIAMV